MALGDCTWGEQADFQVHGALREMMCQGNLSSRLSLEDLDSGKDIYGLGALAELNGEILILGGQILVAKASKGKVTVRQATDHTRDVPMHLMTLDRTLVAHVDDLIILPGAILSLPDP